MNNLKLPKPEYHFFYIFSLAVIGLVIDEYDLSIGQQEIFMPLCRGSSIKSLSSKLGVSKETLERRLTDVYKKINRKEKLKGNKVVFGSHGRQRKKLGQWLLKQEEKLQVQTIANYKDNEVKTIVEEIIEAKCSIVRSKNIHSFLISDNNGNLYDLQTNKQIQLKKIIENKYGSLEELSSSEFLNLLMKGHEIIISILSTNHIEKLKESSECKRLNKDLQTLPEQDIPDS